MNDWLDHVITSEVELRHREAAAHLLFGIAKSGDLDAERLAKAFVFFEERAWQSIDTYPDDARDVLIWAEGYLHPLIAWRQISTGKWTIYGTSLVPATPTHWRSIPLRQALARDPGSAE